MPKKPAAPKIAPEVLPGRRLKKLNQDTSTDRAASQNNGQRSSPDQSRHSRVSKSKKSQRSQKSMIVEDNSDDDMIAKLDKLI